MSPFTFNRPIEQRTGDSVVSAVDFLFRRALRRPGRRKRRVVAALGRRTAN